MGHFSPNGNGKDNGQGSLLAPEPPQNLQAERYVIGALLTENSYFPEVLELISPEDMWRDAHRVIFEAMIAIWLRGDPVDAISLYDEIARGDMLPSQILRDTLTEISEGLPHHNNCVYHARLILSKSIARQATESCTDIIREAQSGLFTAEELVERAANRIGAIKPPAAEPWPEISFQEMPSVKPFPVDVFPLPLQRYCAGVARVTLSPPDLAGCAMLATASAAIGQSMNLEVKRTWRESPLLYLLIVAEPGRSKSPSMKLVVKPLTRIDREFRERSFAERAAWEERKKSEGKSAGIIPEPPQLRAIVKDVTRESLMTILRDNPRGILADPDEATGWVGSFNEYKGKGTDRQFWLDIWGGRPISVDREGGRRSCWVSTPLVTVLGGLPPDMLGALNEEQGRNDGFLDRLLFTFPDTYPGQRWTDDELDEGDETSWGAVIEKLHETNMFHDPKTAEIKPHFIHFDPEAKAEFIAWFDAHCAEMEAEDSPRWMPGVWSKFRAYCGRFCLILSRLRLAMNPECQDLEHAQVRPEDVRNAVRLVDYFKSHVAKVHHQRTAGLGSQDARTIVSWIIRKEIKSFRERDIRLDLRRRFPESAPLTSALNVLIKAGVIRPRPEPQDPHKRGRRPSPAYEVHPDLKEAPQITQITQNGTRVQ